MGRSLSYHPSSLDELKELLSVLREAGVSQYATEGLTLHLGSAPPKPEGDAEWLDIEKRLKQQEARDAQRELEIQFAHVGGPPPRSSSSGFDDGEN